MAWVATTTLLLRSFVVVSTATILRGLYRGYQHRRAVRSLQSQGLVSSSLHSCENFPTNTRQPLLPHSMLLGHLPIFANFSKSHPRDVHVHHFHAWLSANCSTYFPGFDYLPPVVYLDLWPISDSLALITDPGTAAQFTVTTSLPKVGVFMQMMEPLTSCNDIICTEGQNWKTWRSRFNPGFSQRNLNALLPEILEEVNVFVSGLKDMTGTDGKWGPVFQLHKKTINLTFDVICRTAL